ncbi:MAG: sulfotransferase [Myxococcota bacterium]|nr:sulfotransferase [Myxococcota bacterium]
MIPDADEAASPIRARTVVSDETPLQGPVIVVGLPRSGSSFLSHVISQLGDCFIFDDLYLHREAIGRDAMGRLSDAHLRELLHFLGWQIRARLRWGSYSRPNLTEEDVEPMNESLVAAYSGREAPTWYELQREWMTRLALAASARIWGYKCPGEFTHVDQLIEHYPDARFIYLMRDPTNVLASYKNIAGSTDGTPGQYHPVVYASYWRSAASAYRRHVERYGPERVMLVRFEDLVADPKGQADRIADFIGTERAREIDTPAPNTSFPEGGRRGISGLEERILSRVASAEAGHLGYTLPPGRISLRDGVEFAWISLRFAVYQVRRMLRGEFGGWRAIFDRVKGLRD